MKNFRPILHELLAHWLRQDFRNPASDMFVARITTENYAKLMEAASNAVKEVIQKEFDEARKWYAEECYFADEEKRREYEEFLQQEYEELKKEYALILDDTIEDWYKHQENNNER